MSHAEKTSLLPTKFLHADPIEDGAQIRFSGDGRLLSCCSVVSRGAIWDTQTGEFLRSYPAYDLAISPDNRLVATHEFGDNKVSLWLLENGDCVRHFSCAERTYSEFIKVMFDATGEKLILLDGPWIRQWSVKDFSEISFHALQANEEAREVRWFDNDVMAFSIIDPHEVKQTFCVTNISNGVRMFHADFEMRHVLSPTGRIVALRVTEPEPRYVIWDLKELKKMSEIEAKNLGDKALFSANGAYFLQERVEPPMRWPSDYTPKINVWESRTGQMVRSILSPFLVANLVYSHTHEILALVNNYKTVDESIFLDPFTERVLGRAERHPFFFADNHRFSPCGRWFATASTENSRSYQRDPLPRGIVVLTDLSLILSAARFVESE
jgi:WD40 repeat protein